MRLVKMDGIADKRGRCTMTTTMVSGDTLTITGADVEELEDDYIFAPGSQIVTKDSTYMVLDNDNEFVKLTTSGGGGGGGEASSNIVGTGQVGYMTI